MSAERPTAHIIVVGDAASALKVAPAALDSIAGDVPDSPDAPVVRDVRITRTVLRSDVLHAVRGEPLDLIVAVSAAALLATPEFLAAFAARALPVALLIIARQPDEAALERLRAAGVQAEHLTLPVSLERLRDRVQAVLARRPPPTPIPPPPPDPVEAPAADIPAPETQPEPKPQLDSVRNENEMANVNKTLEEAMKIDGAIGVALADWESGLCLGTAGGGSRLNIEVAAAGNCQVVKAKMATMSELGIKGAIQDILITLDDQIHLIRPIKRGDSVFLYVAIDKAKGNLGMARHRLQKLESELTI